MWRIQLADEVLQIECTASLISHNPKSAERVQCALAWFDHAIDAPTITIRLTLEPAPVVSFAVTLVEACGHAFRLEAPGHYQADCQRNQATLALADDSQEAIDFALRNAIKQIFLVRLVHRGGLALHAASVVVKQQAFVFFGPSGVGKTTLCRAHERSEVLNDELTVITPDRLVHRTPYFGELGVLRGRLHAPLQRMFLLDQANHQEVVPMSPVESTRALLRHAAWFANAPMGTRQLTSTCLDLGSGYLGGRLLTQKLEPQSLQRLWSTPGIIG